MYLGCQSADFGLQLLLRLVRLLAEPSKGRSHLPGNTEGTAGQWLEAKPEAGEVFHALVREDAALLLDLMAAVCAGEVDDELQLLACVVHKLALQTALFGLRGPHEPLVEIQQTVQRG